MLSETDIDALGLASATKADVQSIIAAVLDKLTAGVELPEPAKCEGGWETPCEYYFTHDQLLQYGASQRLAGREQAIEECAKVCDEYSRDKWSLYKGRAPYQGNEPGRADPVTQGESDGASNCADALRALAASPQEQTA